MLYVAPLSGYYQTVEHTVSQNLSLQCRSGNGLTLKPCIPSLPPFRYATLTTTQQTSERPAYIPTLILDHADCIRDPSLCLNDPIGLKVSSS
jgi:hypothetical protein